MVNVVDPGVEIVWECHIQVGEFGRIRVGPNVILFGVVRCLGRETINVPFVVSLALHNAVANGHVTVGMIGIDRLLMLLGELYQRHYPVEFVWDLIITC